MLTKAELHDLANLAKVLGKVGLGNDAREALTKLAEAYVGQLEPEAAALVRDAFGLEVPIRW